MRGGMEKRPQSTGDGLEAAKKKHRPSRVTCGHVTCFKASRVFRAPARTDLGKFCRPKTTCLGLDKRRKLGFLQDNASSKTMRARSPIPQRSMARSVCFFPPAKKQQTKTGKILCPRKHVTFSHSRRRVDKILLAKKKPFTHQRKGPGNVSV